MRLAPVRAMRAVTRLPRAPRAPLGIVTGGLTRRCLDALREAGEPAAIDAIAVSALRDKGLDAEDKALRADFGRRFLRTLNRLLQRGAVTKVGYGVGRRWGLPPDEA